MSSLNNYRARARTFNPPESAYHQAALRMQAAFEAVGAATILATPPATHAITLQMQAATRF